MIVGTLNKIAIAVVDDRLLNMIPDEYEIDCFSPDRIVVFVIPEENFEHISESIGIITQNDRSSKKIVKVGLPVDVRIFVETNNRCNCMKTFQRRFVDFSIKKLFFWECEILAWPDILHSAKLGRC